MGSLGERVPLKLLFLEANCGEGGSYLLSLWVAFLLFFLVISRRLEIIYSHWVRYFSAFSSSLYCPPSS
jgi:hypothetical protein